MSPRLLFQQELENLKTRVMEMGERVNISYDQLQCAMRTNDIDTLEHLLTVDRQVQEMQRNVESQCLMLMTRQQPVARDLRLISSALKVVTEIERCADHVGDIAELYMRTDEHQQNDPYEKLLEEMMDIAKNMMRDAAEAFVEGDEALAGEVIGTDDRVDDKFNEMKDGMMKAIREQTLDADHVVDYLQAAKYLEKIGDHAVNIAEWAIFRITGDMQGVKLY